MPFNFTRVRTCDQINEEAARLTALIPCLNEYEATILAQSSVSLPIGWQDRELKRIVGKAVMDYRTDHTIHRILMRWMEGSRSKHNQQRIKRLVAIQ